MAQELARAQAWIARSLWRLSSPPYGLTLLLSEVGGAQALLCPRQALLRRCGANLQNRGDFERSEPLRGAEEKACGVLWVERVQRGS
jgi:hypothetical protein